jgi:hypothetical protein
MVFEEEEEEKIITFVDEEHILSLKMKNNDNK